MFCNVIATFPHDRFSRLYHNLSYATPQMHDERARWQRVAHFLISETDVTELSKILSESHSAKHRGCSGQQALCKSCSNLTGTNSVLSNEAKFLVQRTTAAFDGTRTNDWHLIKGEFYHLSITFLSHLYPIYITCVTQIYLIYITHTRIVRHTKTGKSKRLQRDFRLSGSLLFFFSRTCQVNLRILFVKGT